MTEPFVGMYDGDEACTGGTGYVGINGVLGGDSAGCVYAEVECSEGKVCIGPHSTGTAVLPPASLVTLGAPLVPVATRPTLPVTGPPTASLDGASYCSSSRRKCGVT